MVFYDATDKEKSIYHDVLSLLGIEESDTTTYPVDGTYTRDYNASNNDLAYLAWDSSTDWQFDDSNIAASDTDGSWTYSSTTGLATATATLTSNMQNITLPTDALDVLRVEVKNANGDFERLTPIDESNIGVALDEFEETAGMPRFYDLHGTNLRFFPKVDTAQVTATAGVKLTLKQRDIDQATPADTSQQPPFPVMFHRLVAIKCAIKVAVGKELWEKLTVLKTLQDEGEEKFINYFANRHKALKKMIKPAMSRRLI